MRYNVNCMNMSKMSIITSVLTLVLFGWGCKQAANTPQQEAAKGLPGVEKCQNAAQPFACIVDAAMAANDPTLCIGAGEDKRINCLEAYQEITGVPVLCDVIQDLKFKSECTKALGSVTDTMSAAVATTTTSAANTLEAADGLKIDRK